MQDFEEKYIESLKEDFVKNLRLDFFDEEEIGLIFRDLESLDKRIRQKIFSLCHTLSHASSSLVPKTLKHLKNASRFLSLKEMEGWITHAFDLLDHDGVDQFIYFISRIDENTLWDFLMPRGLSLQDAAPVLETYLRGISGLELKIAPGRETYTDTTTLYLPPFLDRYDESEKNFRLYKIMVAHQWAQITQGTLSPDESVLNSFLKDAPPDHPDIETLFRSFEERDLAVDIYNILEAIRLEPFLEKELPGLMREAHIIKKDFLRDKSRLAGLSGKSAFIEGIYRFYLKGEIEDHAPEILKINSRELYSLKEGAGSHDCMNMLLKFYDIAGRLEGSYHPRSYLPFLGTIKPAEISLHLKEMRRAYQQRLEAMITRIVNLPEFEPLASQPHRAFHQEPVEQNKEYLLIKGRLIKLDSELKDLIDRRGGIPGGTLVTGAETGGAGSPISLKDILEEEETPDETSGGITYDEWDYKRGDYKKNWCTLYEQDIHQGHEPFVELTLGRYSGYVNILRKKFELLKREPKMLRGQRDGDDIDIDALVGTYSDVRAGISPNENIFMRYEKQERNIAVLFLLDMSGSTKGWINTAEKEALVLMAEALEILGDRYAIYGFSGMTRNRCDMYCVKSFEETYSQVVKKRISGIEPKDYTRMGPPIRHSIKILKSIEARTKLLVTLSDGKPEDYDAYKGSYQPRSYLP
ncbi:MAG: hypothetical protein HY758_06680 [Nitrospirae bacterium]|nr:hypothetical protein [Nitrospirota bacterium]